MNIYGMIYSIYTPLVKVDYNWAIHMFWRHEYYTITLVGDGTDEDGGRLRHRKIHGKDLRDFYITNMQIFHNC